MKTTYIILLFSVLTFSVRAQTVSAKIKVSGNCSMCKERIESALDKSGIKIASWNKDTKMLEVAYNSKKVTEMQIHEMIAAVGHDTEKVKAADSVYVNLPFCCLYRDHDHGGKRKN